MHWMVKIGQGVGSCGTAAFRKERVIVEDLNTLPFWMQYKELALSAGLQACWSEPIIGMDGKCYGTFAMYYSTPNTPSEEDLDFIETSANLAAVVFENHENRQLLLQANHQLERTLDTRSQELYHANQRLEKALKDQDQSLLTHVSQEKMETTKSLVVGIAHELNTPIGIAVTSLSTAKELIGELARKVLNKEPIKRSELEHTLTHSQELLEDSESSLFNTNELLGRFKAINVNDYSAESSSYELKGFLEQFKHTIMETLGEHSLELDIEPIRTYISKSALAEMLMQLVENSITHGFKKTKKGLISVHVTQTGNELHINYQDNGSGISKKLSEKVFEPFYVDDRQYKGLGLGLNIVTNIAKNIFHGDIKYITSPIGVRFEIRIPLNKSKAP